MLSSLREYIEHFTIFFKLHTQISLFPYKHNILYKCIYTYLCEAVFQLILSQPVVGSAAVPSLDMTWQLEGYPGEDEPIHTGIHKEY